MSKYVLITTFLLILFQQSVSSKNQTEPPHEKRFAILVASYNNEPWYEKNLQSIYMQEYKNYRVVYLDDQSTDKTFPLVKQYVAKNKQKHRTEIIKNPVRMGSMLARYRAAHKCDNDEIIVYLDGDDYFPDPYVLSYLNSVYQGTTEKQTHEKYKPWMTYGSFNYWCPNCIKLPEEPYTIKTPNCSHGSKPRKIESIPQAVFDNNIVRHYPRCYDHLSTYYAWLFKKIKLKDLVYRGSEFRITTDLAIIYPMLEMAGPRAQAIENKILYLWNQGNPLNCLKIHRGKTMRHVIKKQHPYKRLKDNPLKKATYQQSYKIGTFTLPQDYRLIKKNDLTNNYTHVLLMRDTCKVKPPKNINQWVKQLEKTGAFAAYPLITATIKNGNLNPAPIVPFHKKFGAWQYAFNQKLTNRAKKTDMILLRTHDFKKLDHKLFKPKKFFQFILNTACEKHSSRFSYRSSVRKRQQYEFEHRLAIFSLKSG